MTGQWCLALLVCGSAGWARAESPKSYRIETVAGSADIGDGGPAIAAEIGSIQGLAVDSLGNVYLSDTDHHRVRKVGTNGLISTVAGTGVPGFSGDGGPAVLAQLRLPYGLAVGLGGEVYVADLGNNRVRCIQPDGTIRTVAGNGEQGPTGDSGTAAQASLAAPRNLLLEHPAGNLYISEFEGHRIRKISPDGRITTVAGTGTPGFSGEGGPAARAEIAYPAGLTFDRDGALYFADSQNQRIRRILPDGVIRTVLGGTEDSRLLTPTALAANRYGTLYVADQSYSIRALTSSGAWITVAGTGTPAFAGDGGPAALASLTSPQEIAFDCNGGFYIADGVRIRRVTQDGTIETVAGDAYVRFVGDGDRATSARLFHPTAVALDAAGRLVIADSGTERVRRVWASGLIESMAGTGMPGLFPDGVFAGGSRTYLPMGVAVDPAGNVLIAETGNHRVRRVTADGLISTLAGTGVAGTGTEGKPAIATPLQQPRGVCTDSAGNTFVVDTGNHRVLRVAADGSTVRVAGSGEREDSGDGGLARSAQLRQPTACAADRNGTLFIADTLGHRIRKVAPDGILSTAAGTGVEGASGDEGLAALARLNGPTGVAVDSAGNLYIADTGNHRIRQVTADGIIHSLAGGASSGFSGDGGAALDALLDTPGGLALDGSGRIYFADTNNNRVRRLTPEVEIPPPPLVELSVVSAASLLPGPVAPGEVLTIFGAGMGPDAGVAGTVDAAGQLATQAGGTVVWFDGIPAPMFYAQSTQVNVQVPYGVAGTASTKMEIRFQGQTVATMTVEVAEAAPAFFPVATNQDGSPNSSSEPAPRGTILTLFGTGEGLTNGANQAGQIAQLPYPKPRLPVTLTIAGIPAEILYAGSAPGLVGIFQVNARVPGGYVPAGPADTILTVGHVASPPLRIWLQ